MSFVRTTAINKLLAMKARKKVVQGSTSAGKTYGIIPVLIQRATKAGRLKITVVAETLPAVKEGAVDIFKTVMQETFRWHESRWNATSLTYTFANGSRMQFKSFDSVGKAKAAGKRDILFINEANHISFTIADALMIRSKEIWIDFNPDEPFWAHTETLKEPNSEFLLLTYLDNEACPPETVEDLHIKMRKAFYDPLGDWDDANNVKSKYWANWCKVYVKGETGTLEGTILRDWSDIDNIPAGAELLGYGTDFGKGGKDPTTTIAFYYYDGEIIWDEVVWQSQLSDAEHIQLMKGAGVSMTAYNYCDNAEPSKIKELQLGGFRNAEGRAKETINYGISLIQDRGHFRVTSRSLHLKEELRKWKYDDDGDPVDAFNHGIDAARYFYVGKYGANAKAKISYNRNKKRGR